MRPSPISLTRVPLCASTRPFAISSIDREIAESPFVTEPLVKGRSRIDKIGEQDRNRPLGDTVRLHPVRPHPHVHGRRLLRPSQQQAPSPVVRETQRRAAEVQALARLGDMPRLVIDPVTTGSSRPLESVSRARWNRLRVRASGHAEFLSHRASQ